MLIFFITVRPLNQKFLNAIEIFNELTLLITSCHLFLFTDFVPDLNTRNVIGWCFIAVAGLNIVVNWCALVYKILSFVSTHIKRFINKRRNLNKHKKSILHTNLSSSLFAKSYNHKIDYNDSSFMKNINETFNM